MNDLLIQLKAQLSHKMNFCEHFFSKSTTATCSFIKSLSQETPKLCTQPAGRSAISFRTKDEISMSHLIFDCPSLEVPETETTSFPDKLDYKNN